MKHLNNIIIQIVLVLLMCLVIQSSKMDFIIHNCLFLAIFISCVELNFFLELDLFSPKNFDYFFFKYMSFGN